MGVDITQGRERLGKGLLGGVDKVYLFPYVKYSRSQITISDQRLTVFPATTVYDYHSIATAFNETTEYEGGAVAWNQSFTVEFPRTQESAQIHRMVNKYYRAIYIDRLGNIRILGLYNGLEAQITNETGTDKAGFNGYKVSFTGKENNQAYYLKDLTGITVYNPDNYIFQSGCNFIFQDGNNYIFQ